MPFNTDADTSVIEEVDSPPPSGVSRSLVKFKNYSEDLFARRGERPSPKNHPLDQPKAVQSFHRIMDAYTRELDRQEENRGKMHSDDNFYDGEQWRQTDLVQLEARGQVPLVFNLVATSVDWILGTEKRGRSDYRILPRTKEDQAAAQKKTELMKYISDVNRSPFHRSRAFEDAVKVGLGWLEDGADDDNDGELIYNRYESWRNMLYDSAATDLGLEDGRYWFRSKWVDEDIMVAMFPERANMIERASEDGDRFTGRSSDFGDEAMDFSEDEINRYGSLSRYPNRFARRRLRVIEGWYRTPTQAGRIAGGQFSGEIYDPWSKGHRLSIDTGEAELIQKPIMRMHCTLATTQGLLYLNASPYRHNKSPFTPIWGYRRGKDGLPYGLIRRVRDINEDFNKRASKALYILSSNKVVMDEGAVDDLDEFAEEVARPDAIIVKRAGKELTLNADRELAQEHMQLMDRDAMLIQSASGVTDENLGRKTNATSGVAIERRQTQGSVSSTRLFDNLRYASQIEGEKQLSLAEQFISEEKQIRITNQRGVPSFSTVNDPEDPDSDITSSKADFVISEADWRASIRQQNVDSLLEATAKMPPEVQVGILDLVVEEMDLANREEIVKRIRSITGQRDPDQTEPTPEDMAKAEEQAKQKKLQEDFVLAELRKLISEAVKNEAAAKKTDADTARSNITSMGGAKRGAIDIAADIISAPGIIPVADRILEDAGYASKLDQIETAAQQLSEEQAAETVPGLPQSAAARGLAPQPATPDNMPGIMRRAA
jgi:hypothetical protein